MCENHTTRKFDYFRILDKHLIPLFISLFYSTFEIQQQIFLHTPPNHLFAFLDALNANSTTFYNTPQSRLFHSINPRSTYTYHACNAYDYPPPHPFLFLDVIWFLLFLSSTILLRRFAIPTSFLWCLRFLQTPAIPFDFHSITFF